MQTLGTFGSDQVNVVHVPNRVREWRRGFKLWKGRSNGFTMNSFRIEKRKKPGISDGYGLLLDCQIFSPYPVTSGYQWSVVGPGCPRPDVCHLVSLRLRLGWSLGGGRVESVRGGTDYPPCCSWEVCCPDGPDAPGLGRRWVSLFYLNRRKVRPWQRSYRLSPLSECPSGFTRICLFRPWLNTPYCCLQLL